MELVKILIGIAKVFTEPVVVLAFFSLISFMYFYIKVDEKNRNEHKENTQILVERLRQNDKNNKEITKSLNDVSIQLEKIATITEIHGKNIDELKENDKELQKYIKELEKEKQDKN